jgi:hypothetical protein
MFEKCYAKRLLKYSCKLNVPFVVEVSEKLNYLFDRINCLGFNAPRPRVVEGSTSRPCVGERRLRLWERFIVDGARVWPAFHQKRGGLRQKERRQPRDERRRRSEGAKGRFPFRQPVPPPPNNKITSRR